MNLKDEQFKKVEKMLYRYFESGSEIKGLQEEKKLLDQQYKWIDKRLRTNNYTIEEQSSCIGFEERVQSSCDGISYVEKELLKFAESDLKEQRYIVKKIFRIDKRIREIERNNIRIAFNIDMLGDEYKRFIYLKYRDKERIDVICTKINMSRSMTYELRRKIVEDIARWINII